MTKRSDTCALTVEDITNLLKEHGGHCGSSANAGRNERSLRRWVNKHVKGKPIIPNLRVIPQ